MEERVFQKQNPLFARLSCCWCVVSVIAASSFETTYCKCDVGEMQIPAARTLPPSFPYKKHDGPSHLPVCPNFHFLSHGGNCVSHLLVLKDLQEERREEFVGTLHLHVEEAAGVARPDHPQVRHLHQELRPEVGNVVLAVVDVVLKRQQVGLLALLDLVHGGQARAVWWRSGEGEEERQEEVEGGRGLRK